MSKKKTVSISIALIAACLLVSGVALAGKNPATYTCAELIEVASGPTGELDLPDMARELADCPPADMTRSADIAKMVRLARTLPNSASMAELSVNCTAEDQYGGRRTLSHSLASLFHDPVTEYLRIFAIPGHLHQVVMVAHPLLAPRHPDP